MSFVTFRLFPQTPPSPASKVESRASGGNPHTSYLADEQKSFPPFIPSTFPVLRQQEEPLPIFGVGRHREAFGASATLMPAGNSLLCKESGCPAIKQESGAVMPWSKQQV
jgi:hypothetical protein